jgi:hypothetical protein
MKVTSRSQKEIFKNNLGYDLNLINKYKDKIWSKNHGNKKIYKNL